MLSSWCDGRREVAPPAVACQMEGFALGFLPSTSFSAGETCTVVPAPACLWRVRVHSRAAVLGAQPPSSVAHRAEPGEETDQGPPTPHSAAGWGFPLPLPCAAQGSCFFPPKSVW